MNSRPPIVTFILGVIAFGQFLPSLRADAIVVAIEVVESGQRVTIVPSGGLGLAKGPAITGQELFKVANLTGDELKPESQIKIFFNKSVWARTDDNRVSRYPSAGMPDDRTVFQLKDAADGHFKLQAPGGGWVGEKAEGGKSLTIEDNEQNAITVNFIINPEH